MKNDLFQSGALSDGEPLSCENSVTRLFELAHEAALYTLIYVYVHFSFPLTTSFPCPFLSFHYPLCCCYWSMKKWRREKCATFENSVPNAPRGNILLHHNYCDLHELP